MLTHHHAVNCGRIIWHYFLRRYRCVTILYTLQGIVSIIGGCESVKCRNDRAIGSPGFCGLRYGVCFIYYARASCHRRVMTFHPRATVWKYKTYFIYRLLTNRSILSNILFSFVVFTWYYIFGRTNARLGIRLNYEIEKLVDPIFVQK